MKIDGGCHCGDITYEVGQSPKESTFMAPGPLAWTGADSSAASRGSRQAASVSSPALALWIGLGAARGDYQAVLDGVSVGLV